MSGEDMMSRESWIQAPKTYIPEPGRMGNEQRGLSGRRREQLEMEQRKAGSSRVPAKAAVSQLHPRTEAQQGSQEHGLAREALASLSTGFWARESESSASVHICVM